MDRLMTKFTYLCVVNSVAKKFVNFQIRDPTLPQGLKLGKYCNEKSVCAQDSII